VHRYIFRVFFSFILLECWDIEVEFKILVSSVTCVVLKSGHVSVGLILEVLLNEDIL
jgi:hypothetical protein